MKTSYFYLLGIVVVLTISCKNKSVLHSSKIVNQSTPYDLFLNFKQQKSNGNIYISGDDRNSNTNLCRYNIRGNVTKDIETNPQKIAYGNLSVGSQQIQQISEFKEYSQVVNAAELEGQNVPIKIHTASNSVEFSTNLYFSPGIRIEVPTSIETGSTITWNTDANNKLGLILQITYGFDRIKREDYIGEKYIYIPNDNGSYNLTAKDMKHVVTKGDKPFVSIVLWRGDYKMAYAASDSTLSCKFVYATADSKIVKLK